MIKKRVVAFFLMVLIVFSTFSIANINLVSAQSTSTSQVCCEQTIDGETCQFTTKDKCNLNAKTVSASCEQTSYCKLGSCFIEDEGRCFKNVPQATCNSQKGIYFNEPSCSIPQAQQGCCLLGNEAAFTTLARCKIVTSQFPDVEMTFDESITDEVSCLERSRSQEKGACVKSDGTCEFTSRDACNTAGLEQDVEDPLRKVNLTSIGFHKDFLCSNELLGTECAKQQTTRCYEEDVYWFDSCGNPENIYDSSKARSNNNGFRLETPSCDADPNDPNCGNCDYGLGTLCGEAPKDVTPAFGDFVCKSVDCSTTKKENAVSPNAGGKKKNGESWCVYDAATGEGRDVVGSRHFRRLCVNNEEITEPCRDFREEICVQGVLGEDPFGTEESFGLSVRSGKFVEAGCRVNRNQGCPAIEGKDDCENIAVGDCFWLATGIKPNGKTGVCIPTVPKGLRFWSDLTGGEDQILGQGADANVNVQKLNTPGAEATSVCSQGSRKCEISYRTGGVAKIFGTSLGFSDEDECVNNCHCEERNWVVAAHNTCVALGDCGAYYNIAGDFSPDGASIVGDVGGSITVNEIGKWNKGTLSTDPYKKPKFFDEIKDNKLLLVSLVAIGLSGFRSLAVGPGFTAGLYGGAGLALSPFTSLFAWKSTVPAAEATIGATYGSVGTTVEIAAAKKLAIDSAAAAKVGVEKLASASAKTVVAKAAEKAAIEAASAEIVRDAASANVAKAAANEALLKTASERLAEKAAIDKLAVTKATGPSTAGSVWGYVNAAAIVIGVTLLVDQLFAKTKKKEVVLECNSWQAPEGGANCRKCGKDGKGCSEYRCKSLGQNCALINEGTGKEECINRHPNDVNSPTISPLIEAIEKGFTIKELTEEGIRGFQLNEQVEPFKAVNVGIKLNEPAQCKYATNNSIEFENMPNFFGSTLFEPNHTLTLRLPGELAEPQALRLTNGGQHRLYLRCKDTSGNENERDYLIKFKIKSGPDLTPPIIEQTSIQNGAFIPQGANETNLAIYVNEPSSCKWDRRDTDFKVMENNFQCVTTGIEQDLSVFGLYRCNTILKGLDFGENNFFFRCKDQPNKQENLRNVNEESLAFTLSGTTSLQIQDFGPEGVLFEIPTLRVVTSGGAENGKALCGFSESNSSFEAMAQFFNSDSTTHTQELILEKGNYNYFMKCRDKAANEVSTQVNFRLDIDVTGPRLSTIFKDTSSSLLHLETNEDSICEYSNAGSFRFGEGTLMTGQQQVHEATLVSQRYHIICKDNKDNEVKFVIVP